MADEKTPTLTPETKARVEGVEKSPVAKVVAEVSTPDSKRTPAKAEKEQPSKTDIREEDDEQQLVDEIKRRAEEEHKDLSSIGDILFEQQVFAKGLVMGIQISLDNMSGDGDDAPFTKKQRIWSMEFLSRRLAQLNRDQGAMKEKLNAADDGTKNAYIEARNSERLKLILMGLGVMSLKKESVIRKIGRQSVMKGFFSYAFQCTTELHKGEDAKFSALNQLYSLTLIDHSSKEDVQTFFSSIHMDELNISDKADGLTSEDDAAESDPRISMYRDVEVAKDGDKPEHAKAPPSKPEFSQDTTERGAKRDIAQRVLQDEAGVSTIPKG